MKRRYKILIAVGGVTLLLAGALFLLSRKTVPEAVTYGMSFNTLYARELGLPWRDVYDAFLDDLGVRHLRLAAHWPMVEPERDRLQFEELDYQLARAEEEGADVILAVGKRLPRWPECHIPGWAEDLSWGEQKQEIRELIRAVVERYKDNEAITHWQVENEPFLGVFAREHCRPLDVDFLEEEISLVKALDSTRPVIVTDSGNLGTWTGAYRRGDVFGTSVYVYFWNPELGQFKTVLPPWFYRVKDNLMAIRYGEKPTLLIELSAEPWLVDPITEVPVETQFSRMNLEKFKDIVVYAKQTRFEMQYLWGGEWWYWLRDRGHPELWEYGRTLFQQESTESP